MYKEAGPLAKQLIGYKAGVTYKFGDWLLATALNCEALLKTTKGTDTLQRVAIANALEVLDQIRWVFFELKAAESDGITRGGFRKAYRELNKNHPAFIEAYHQISRLVPSPYHVHFLSPPQAGRAEHRFIKTEPLQDLRNLAASAKKDKSALNEATITLDTFYGNYADGKEKEIELPVSESVEPVTCAYTLRVGTFVFQYHSNLV